MRKTEGGLGEDLGAAEWDRGDSMKVDAAPALCLYATLLKAASPERLADFLLRHFETQGISAGDLSRGLEDLWTRGSVSAEFSCAIHSGFETFLLGEGQVPITGLSGAMSFIQGNSIFLPEVLLKTLRNFIPDLFTAADPMLELSRAIALLTGMAVPSCHCWPSAAAPSGTFRFFHMFFAPDAGFRVPMPYDCEFFSAPYLMPVPRIFNLPAYDTLRIRADQRPLDAVIGKERLSRRGARILLDGSDVAEVADFRSHLSGMGLEGEAGKFPPWKAVVATRDVACPVRKRIVIRQGCAYGAPAYLLKFGYRSGYPRPDDFLSPAIISLGRDKGLPGGADADTHGRHERVLGRLVSAFAFRYDAATGRASLGGKSLARGVQARILRAILSDWNRTGRTRFDFRRFKYDASLFANPKCTGFEIHLGRLREKLSSFPSPISFRTVAPGEFVLSVDPSLRIEAGV